MTVIDPAAVDWTALGELSVISAARCGIGQAIDEGLRRGLWFEGEEPPDPLAGWFRAEKAGAGDRFELRARETSCSCRRCLATGGIRQASVTVKPLPHEREAAFSSG